MKNIFIFDLFVGGHHEYFNDLLIEALLAKGECQVYLITSQEIYKKQLYQKWKTLSPDLNVITLEKRFRGDTARPWHFQEIHALIKQYNPVHIYVQMLDTLILTSLVQFITRRRWFNVPWSAIYFRPVMAHKTSGIKCAYFDLEGRKERFEAEIKSLYIKKLALDPNLISIHLFDENEVEYYNRSVNRIVFRHIADPIIDPYFESNYDIAELRGKSNFAMEDYIYLSYGVHTRRKGTDVLLQSFMELKESPQYKHAKLFIVGKVSDQRIIELLKRDKIKELQLKGDLVLINRYVSEEESLYYFRISDCICLPYINHLICTSSVLVKGLIMNKQIIATDQYWMGYYVKKHRLGVTCSQNDVGSLYEAMQNVYAKRVKHAFTNRDFFRSSNFQKSLINDLNF